MGSGLDGKRFNKMSRKGWTEVVPCHGCKRIVGRPKNGVCGECRSLMLDGGKFRKNAEMIKSQKDVIGVSIPDSWERPRFDCLISGAYNYSDGEPLGKAFALLARELIQQSEKHNYDKERGFILFRKKKDRNYEYSQVGYMPKRIAGLLHKIWMRVNKLIIEREKHAYEYGGSIIKQIATGDATVNDFEDQIKDKHGKI